MKGSKILLFSSIILAIYGGVNIIYCIILWLGASSVDSALLDFSQYGLILIAYLAVQGLVPFIVGGLGLFWHNNRTKVNIIFILAWILLIVEYAIFFTSYGASIFTIIFDIGCIIVSLCYFYAARKNREEVLDYQKKANA